MEYLEENNRNQEKIERLILILYGIYNIAMCADLLRLPGNIGTVIAMLLAMVIAWGAKVANLRTVKFRAMVTVLMLEISIVLYATQLYNILQVLTLALVGVIIVALYNIPQILIPTFLGTVVIYLYHFFVLHSICYATGEEVFYDIMTVGNVFLAEYLVYYLVKKREESIVQFFKVIDVLQEAEHSKDDFLSNVSHEIRTPINTICGMSELVQGEEDPRKMRDALFDIQQAGRNLLSVVSDILDFSELQSGKIEIQEEEYNISSTINDIINMSLARKNQKKIEFIVDCDANIPKGLLGDEKKLRRIIMNLVNNAIKFTKDGGVTIHISSRQEEYGINLIITVSDTGIGMEAKNMEKIFTSFSQIDTRKNRQEGGIGLGLAISQALVERMGGVITIKSKLGKGTAVRVVVPQKVIDAQPIAQLEKKDEINIAVYIDMEQFGLVAIRDQYTECLSHMVNQLQTKCHICRNLAELKRRIEREKFTHIIVSIVEYEEDRKYFDKLAETISLVVILNREDEDEMTNANIIRIYKPFYVLSIVNVLNHGNQMRTVNRHHRKFIAPEVRVLVVDDNLMNIRVIEGLLDKYRIKVSRAMSGREALEKIESKEFDFVFMDHMMPEMDGIETFHRIRNKVGNYFQKVPIVALTANAVAGSREKFMEEGFNDFVEKPVEVSVLERVLHRTLKEEKIQYIDDETAEMETVGVTAETNETSGEPGSATAVNKPQKSSEFMIGDLDVEKGISFCGSKEKYIDILAECYGSSSDMGKNIERLYREENWQEYTIMVHGLKSTMMGIGAVPLSGQAKELEMAGKADDIELIRGRHDGMMAEYRRVMREIADDPQVDTEGRVGIEQIDLSEILDRNKEGDTEEAEDTPDTEEAVAASSDLQNLSEERFDEMFQELEDAAYSIDGEEMKEVLEELIRYRYHGKKLQELLKSVFHKIEMSDYLSALELVEKVRKKILSEGGAQ
ncbi:MAG: response regulator [Lachnospiraceae bacterium]|nr:response regulator [Lachnospiraceae bacterium]